jgi:hypothetical protein
MTPEDRIVRDFADVVCKRIARQTRAALTKMTDCRLSGDDSVLKNSWEEICVQLQGEQSIFWSAYETTINALITGHVGILKRFELEAIWLQTDDAFDQIDEEVERNRPSGDRPGVNEDSVIDYIRSEYVFALASDWSNHRIRKYIDSGYGG